MNYIPNQGDVIWVTFDPQAGHEQKGRRPALVVSNIIFNKNTGLALVCPITNKDNRFPLHVKLKNQKTSGFVMIEQFKSIDYNSRNAELIEKIDEDTIVEILSRLNACF